MGRARPRRTNPPDQSARVGLPGHERAERNRRTVRPAAVALTRSKPKTWRCKCGHRNIARTSSRRCEACGENTKPAPRTTKAKPVDSYEVYELLSVTIHGGDAGACGCCGRSKPETYRHDREHDHKTGKPRGLGC